MTAAACDLSTLDSSRPIAWRLPPTLREIHDLLGWQGTLTLVERYGGTHVHVPRRWRNDHELTALLGREPAARFIRHFAGVRLYIAKMDAVLRAARDAEIRKLYDSGVSAARLAQKYRLSERRVWSILKGVDGG